MGALQAVPLQRSTARKGTRGTLSSGQPRQYCRGSSVSTEYSSAMLRSTWLKARLGAARLGFTPPAQALPACQRFPTAQRVPLQHATATIRRATLQPPPLQRGSLGSHAKPKPSTHVGVPREYPAEGTRAHSAYKASVAQTIFTAVRCRPGTDHKCPQLLRLTLVTGLVL
jgi:hypothetical protein